MWWIIGIILLVAFVLANIEKGYNELDAPDQLRKQTRLKEQELKMQKEQIEKQRLKELETEKEILLLKKEIEELKKNK